MPAWLLLFPLALVLILVGAALYDDRYGLYPDLPEK